MTIEEMKRKKREYGYSAKELAALAGVPVGTLQKILSGATKSPRRETLLKLEKILKEGIADSAGDTGSSLSPGTGVPGGAYPEVSREVKIVKETGPAYVFRNDGEYTLKDYLALPEDRRVELIDGVFYDMAAPTTIHQGIGGFIHKQLLDFALERKGPCLPFMSPVDVQLDEDDKTVVQPDVLIICDRSKLQNGRVFGAPDFLVEVLSPSTRKKDMRLKLYKYANAGVREYWIVDPEKKTVVVYDLEHDAAPALYGFADKVPVLVWDGQCQVDFAAIYETFGFLYDQ